MTPRAQKLADQVLSAAYGSRPVFKGAAVAEERRFAEGLVRGLVEQFDAMLAEVEEHVEYTGKALKAIHRQGEPGSAGWVPLRAGQWRVDLAPNVPPERMDRYDSPFSVPREER